MFSRFFIDRPIFASVLSIVITLAGAMAVFSLPVAQYPPEITPPTVEVSAIFQARCASWRARRLSDRRESQRRRRHDVHGFAVHERR